MKDFFKYVLASLVSFVIVLIIFFIIVGGIIASIVSSVSLEKDKLTEAKPNSVLHMKLDYEIPERSPGGFMEDLDFGPLSRKMMGLNDILDNIEKAAKDDNIKGIYVNLNGLNINWATLDEIRNELIKFKKSGKFLIAHGDFISERAFYLGSISDKLYLTPTGLLELTGLSVTIEFFKNTLDKLDVDVQIFKSGKYKSAVEPFFREDMSPESEEMVQSYLGSVYGHFKAGIQNAKNISPQMIDSLANNLLVTDDSSALKYNLVNGLKYQDEIHEELREELGLEEDDEINFVALNKYKDVKLDGESTFGKEKIAIVFAAGPIEMGKGDAYTIGAQTTSKAIRDARKDDKVKAIVLRINSPGGSALASEIILREVNLAAEVKPVIVSMSDYAASGGYYIACSADSIFAHEATLTGSIGVFGLLPNVRDFFSNKLGITFDGVKTNEHADLGSIVRDISPEEEMVIQKEVNDIYKDFKRRVAKGRNMSMERVEELAQGRVWTGAQALEIGLVDAIGGMEDAVAAAAEKAGLEEYRIAEYPKQKNFFEELMGGLTGEVKKSVIKEELGATYRYYQHLKSVLETKGAQARLPFEIQVH